MHLPEPVFPPLLAGHDVKAPLRPFSHACRQASRGTLGAGDLVWSRNTSRAECAIVLEPEVPLGTALQMNALAQVALADSLGALLPPAVCVWHRWPGTILVNGAECGGVVVGLPATEAGQVPDWMVVGMSLRLIHDDPDKEPGELPGQTALAEEGGGEITRTDLLQCYASYLLSWLNTWQEDGFRPIHDSWMARAEADGKAMEVEHEGTRQVVQVLGLDEEGGLLIRPEAGPARVLPLIERIEVYRRELAR